MPFCTKYFLLKFYIYTYIYLKLSIVLLLYIYPDNDGLTSKIQLMICLLLVLISLFLIVSNFVFNLIVNDFLERSEMNGSVLMTNDKEIQNLAHCIGKKYVIFFKLFFMNPSCMCCLNED